MYTWYRQIGGAFFIFTKKNSIKYLKFVELNTRPLHFYYTSLMPLFGLRGYCISGIVLPGLLIPYSKTYLSNQPCVIQTRMHDSKSNL